MLPNLLSAAADGPSATDAAIRFCAGASAFRLRLERRGRTSDSCSRFASCSRFNRFRFAPSECAPLPSIMRKLAEEGFDCLVLTLDQPRADLQ
jgi:hypothetical protein